MKNDMKKAVIIYHSKTGRTRSYAEKISKYLKEKDIELIKTDLEDFKSDMFENVDFIFHGCWTHGLFVIFQHPDKEWKKFAKNLPEKKNVKLALFTTYKIMTGSMFRNMKKILKGRFDDPTLCLRSKNTVLSDKDKLALTDFIK